MRTPCSARRHRSTSSTWSRTSSRHPPTTVGPGWHRVPVPHLMLGWRIALAGALALVVAAGLLALLRPQGRRGRVAVAAVRESGIVLGLFAVWQLAGTFAHHNATGAGRRGQEILDAEADLHLPSEHSVQ